MTSLFCVQRADGVVLEVRVVPRAGASAIAGTRDGALLVRLAAAPVAGAANDALVRLLAEHLRVPRAAIGILAGERGRRKRLLIAGMTADLVRDRLLRPS